MDEQTEPDKLGFGLNTPKSLAWSKHEPNAVRAGQTQFCTA